MSSESAAPSSRDRASQAADRAVDAARGPYGEGIDLDKLVEALEAEGWEFRG